jgi:peptidoglycan/LPS O-acetylase OafA/YrhL
MLRYSALLAAGALAVHQLRYLLAGSAPDASVHGYLGPAGSLLAGLMVVALARMVLGRAARMPRLGVLWPSTAVALVAIYCAQETAEGVSPVAGGGWLAAPLALLVALVIALVARGAGRASARARRPWRAPLAERHPASVASALAVQARPAGPRLRPARGPPLQVAVT